MPNTTLYYVHDPMCSWCWGYRPTWDTLQAQLQQQLGQQLTIKYLAGGLAPDSDLPMPRPMQQILQQTWQKITQQLGTKFNHDFWHLCQPRRSTYPACRASIIARQYGLEKSGSRRCLASSPHTTLHAAPHRAVHLEHLIKLSD
jgi:putative protein-disulfide isomerase